MQLQGLQEEELMKQGALPRGTTLTLVSNTETAPQQLLPLALTESAFPISAASAAFSSHPFVWDVSPCRSAECCAAVTKAWLTFIAVKGHSGKSLLTHDMSRQAVLQKELKSNL